MSMKSDLFTLLLSFLIVQCYGQSFLKSGIVGGGPAIERSIDIQEFKGVRNAFSCEVHIAQGAEHAITVKAHALHLDNMTFEISNDLLTINRERLIKQADRIEVYITMPYFTQLSVSGSGSLETSTLFADMDEVQVALSGSGRINLETEAKAIYS